jgi:hypothetical protein
MGGRGEYDTPSLVCAQRPQRWPDLHKESLKIYKEKEGRQQLRMARWRV